MSEIAYPRLRLWNLGLAALHGAQAVGIAAVASARKDIAIPLVTSYTTYAGPTGWTNHIEETGLSIRAGLGSAVFCGITALFHLALGTAWRARYEEQVRAGINQYRWIEYSITSSIMAVLLALLCGARDIYHILCVFALFASMNFFAISFERENDVTGALEEPRDKDEDPRARVEWFNFWAGFLPFAAAWATVLGFFVGAVNLASMAVPTFVWGIVVSLTILMLVFPLALWLHGARVGPWRSNEFSEATFMVLSLVAKSILAWQVVGGAQRF